MTGVDQRSVGELLLEADHTARSILVDVGEMDAATMLRTWGEVVQAAAELWQALPTTTPPLPGTERRTPDAADLTMQRLDAMTNARHRRRESDWPGDGPPDERHLQIAAAFARAEELISRYANQPTVLNARQRADLNAARTRIMHTLYLGAHGVNIAVGQHMRGLESKVAIHGTLPAGQSLRQVRTAYEHLTAFEQLAGAIVAKTYPAALAGEHRDPPAASRLAQALAEWDVVGHRALVDAPRTAELMLAARTQALILTGSSALLRAAAATGDVDAHHRDRLEPALVATQERWETLAVTIAALIPPHERRTNPDLTRASLEVRATLRELLLDAATTATPAVIAQRTELGLIPSTVGQALAANLDLAHVTSQALQDRSLTGAARGIHEMATAIWRKESHHPNTIDDSPVRAAVTPKDLLANRAIPLPNTVRSELSNTAVALVEAAGAAMSAGTHLGSRTRPHTQCGDPSSSLGRATQDRVVGFGISKDRPGLGCDR